MYSRWEEKRDEAVLAMLDYRASADLVDLGCGDGKFSTKVKEQNGGEILGVDLCEESLEKAKNRGIRVEKVDLDRPLPFKDKSFDVIVSNQVIEHLVYPVRFMKEVYRILKPDGYAVVSTENLASLDNMLALLLGYTPFSMEFDCGIRKIGNPWSPHNEEVISNYDYPHLRIFTKRGIVKLMESLKFNIEQTSCSGHILGKIGEALDGARCRFITLKVRKAKS